MLSLKSPTITARAIQSAMSAATNNAVKSKGLIQQETAKAAGFTSFEQAQSICSRSNMIMDKVWIERSLMHNNNLVVRAVNYSLVINTSQGSIDIYRQDNIIKEIALPEALYGYCISEDMIEYCPKMHKLVIRIPSKDIDIVFHRSSPERLGLLVANSKGDNTVFAVSFSQEDTTSVDRWYDDELQTARLLAECVMICEDNTTVESVATLKYNITGIEMEAACETALWLFEVNKGYTGKDIDDLKPKHAFKQAMGFFAHLFLSHYYTQNEQALAELCESASFELSELDDMICRAKAEADWFLFTHY